VQNAISARAPPPTLLGKLGSRAVKREGGKGGLGKGMKNGKDRYGKDRDSS